MLVKNQREQRHVLKGHCDCWQWKAIGQCSKRDNCSFRHEKIKRAKPATQPAPSPEYTKPQDVKDSANAKSPGGRSPSGRMNRMPCKDHLKGTCANPSCEKWHFPECSFYKSAEGCKFGDKCAFAHRRVEEQPSKRSKRSDEKKCSCSTGRDKEFGLCISGRGAAKIIVDFTEELNHAKTNPMCSIHHSSAAQCQTSRPKPSLNKICPGDSHHRSPNAPKFEDRSQEETEWQEHWARDAAWKRLEKHKATFFSPTEKWCFPSPMVKNHVSSKMVFGFDAIWKTTYRSWSRVFRLVVRRAHQHFRHHYRRKVQGSTPIPASS